MLMRGGGPSNSECSLVIFGLFSFLRFLSFFTSGSGVLVEDIVLGNFFFGFSFISISIRSLLGFSDGSVHEEIDHDFPVFVSWDFISEHLDFSGEEIEHKTNGFSTLVVSWDGNINETEW